ELVEGDIAHSQLSKSRFSADAARETCFASPKWTTDDDRASRPASISYRSQVCVQVGLELLGVRTGDGVSGVRQAEQERHARLLPEHFLAHPRIRNSKSNDSTQDSDTNGEP